MSLLGFWFRNYTFLETSCIPVDNQTMILPKLWLLKQPQTDTNDHGRICPQSRATEFYLLIVENNQ